MNGDSSDRGGEESRWSGKEEEKRGRKSSLLSVLASAGDSAQKRHFSLQQICPRDMEPVIDNLRSRLSHEIWQSCRDVKVPVVRDPGRILRGRGIRFPT
ncbi:uncharacterized protein [Coffea arabica]|uniref:Uncharacterized protein isoform X2 n=1 Tax=Coffea arabica TaxID=13443 RepID=A0ABM4VXR7_COFAR